MAVKTERETVIWQSKICWHYWWKSRHSVCAWQNCLWYICTETQNWSIKTRASSETVTGYHSKHINQLDLTGFHRNQHKTRIRFIT